MKKAVLFIVFNRFEETKKTFEQIKIAQPPRLYISSDGERADKKGEKEIVEEIRNWLLKNIDWDCELKTRFMDENLGCGYGVYKSIDWFFEQEPEGIILEDDCVPSQSFFTFCEELLDKYRDNKKIWHISGSNFLEELNTAESYYFSKIMHGWGWATWADRWKYFEFDMKDYDEKHIKNFSKNKNVQKFWHNILVKMKNYEIEAWDYQWLFEIIKRDQICITPQKNLIKNIGFTGVHFNNSYDHHRLNKETFEINSLTHPKEISINVKTMNKLYEKVFLINTKKTLFQVISKLIKDIMNGVKKINFKIINNELFFNYNPTKSLNTSVGFNKKKVVKVENYEHEEKLNNLAEEAKIIKYLNEKNCICCPKLLKHSKNSEGKDYIILKRIKNKGKAPQADLMFSLLEQKKLGVWHGDIKPENVVFDGKTAFLIDYDQARFAPEIIDMDNIEFLRYMANDLEKKWSRGFLQKNLNSNTVDDFVNIFFPFFNDGAFKLGETTIFKKQVTTISDTGFYHTIKSKDVFIEGMRDIDSRTTLMEQINFSKGEKILDFGCNAGLLSFYLHDRGADVSGCDMDKNIITAAKALSNILQKKVNFFKCDIDYETFEDNYDTICLFSVIHHTKYMERNAKFIASKCNRIIMECRLKELGQKPTSKNWVYTSKWDFETQKELTAYLENLFPGFKLEKIWGQGDRERFIITFNKNKNQTQQL